MNNIEKINAVLFTNLQLKGYNGFKEPSDIKPEHHIVDDLGADSLDEVEILMALEDEFETEISDFDGEQWKKAGDIYNYFS